MDVDDCRGWEDKGGGMPPSGAAVEVLPGARVPAVELKVGSILPLNVQSPTRLWHSEQLSSVSSLFLWPSCRASLAVTAELVRDTGIREGRATGAASSSTDIEEPMPVRPGIADEMDGPCAIVIIVPARLSEGVVGRDSVAGWAGAQPKTEISAASWDGSGLLLSPSVAEDRRSVVMVAVSASTSIDSCVSTGNRTEVNADMRFWT